MNDTGCQRCFGLGAAVLHWAMVPPLLIAWPLGLVIANLEALFGRAEVAGAIATHEALGLAVLALLAARVVWRAAHPAPAPGPEVAPVHRWAARLVQAGLYLLLALVPALGLMAVWAVGESATVLGPLALPPPFPANEALATTMKEWHGLAAFALAFLVGVHVAAAVTGPAGVAPMTPWRR